MSTSIGKTGYVHKKNKTKSLSYTLHKNLLKIE